MHRCGGLPVMWAPRPLPLLPLVAGLPRILVAAVEPLAGMSECLFISRQEGRE